MSYDDKYKDELGFDSTTHYNSLMLAADRFWNKEKKPLNYDEFVDESLRGYEKARVAAERDGAVYFPNVTCGWDTNSRYPADNVQLMVHKANPKDFERFLRGAKDFVDKKLPKGLPKLVTVNSWNEWTEGSYLEPDDHFGYGYLNALQRAFSAE